jgi:hypothetical protein
VVASARCLEQRGTTRVRAEWASARRLLRERGEGKRGFASVSRRLGPARGAAHGAVAACTACGGREAHGACHSGSWRGRDTTLVVSVGARSERRLGAHSGNWPGGPAQSKPMWPRAGIKMELDRTEQCARPGKSFPIF